MSAAVATATAVESAATAAMEAATVPVAVEATTTAATEAFPATEAFTAAVSATVARASIAIAGVSIAVAIAATVPVPIYRPAVEAAAAVVTAIPGAGADKDAAIEPRRPIVPIGRTGVGVVAVVTIGTDWSRVAVTISWATDPNSNRDLGMRIGRGREQQDTEYSEIA
jgi:hypothetical protein